MEAIRSTWVCRGLFPLIRPGGHLLPRGEGSDAPGHAGSMCLGLPLLVLQFARTTEVDTDKKLNDKFRAEDCHFSRTFLKAVPIVILIYKCGHTTLTNMKTWIAILFTIGLLVASGSITVLAGFQFNWIMVPATSLWAAIDSSKIQLKRYKSGISYGPVALFFLIALVWIIGFPWYLAMRYKIKTGTAILKDGDTNVAA
jgi:hypothetical protein